MRRRKELDQLGCEACGRTGTVTPGPRGEHGMCECGAIVRLPAKTPWTIDRRSVLGFLGAIASGVIGNLITPTVSRMSNLISKREIKPIETRVADQMAMTDQVVVIPSFTLGSGVGTPRIVQSPPENDQSNRA